MRVCRGIARRRHCLVHEDYKGAIMTLMTTKELKRRFSNKPKPDPSERRMNDNTQQYHRQNHHQHPHQKHPHLPVTRLPEQSKTKSSTLHQDPRSPQALNLINLPAQALNPLLPEPTARVARISAARAAANEMLGVLCRIRVSGLVQGLRSGVKGLVAAPGAS